MPEPIENRSAVNAPATSVVRRTLLCALPCALLQLAVRASGTDNEVRGWTFFTLATRMLFVLVGQCEPHIPPAEIDRPLGCFGLDYGPNFSKKPPPPQSARLRVCSAAIQPLTMLAQHRATNLVHIGELSAPARVLTAEPL